MPTRRKGPRDRRSAPHKPVVPADEQPLEQVHEAETEPPEEGAATAEETVVPAEEVPEEPETVAEEVPVDESAVPEPGDSSSQRVLRRNPHFPLGVNYYPLDTETQSWDDWYAGDIAADLSAFADARLTLVRVFISWKMFEPQVGQYSDLAEERLQDLVEAARESKLQLIVCFFADDRLAEMLDVPWGKKRDPHTDSYLQQRQIALVQRIVNRYRAEQSVFAWDLANEAFCAGFTSSEAMQQWADALREAIREVDQTRPVLLSVDPETLFRHTGVDARPALEPCEIRISHVTAPYRVYAAEGPLTSGPSTYLESFLLRAGAHGAPVILDDVGVHSLDHSHVEEAAAVRTALYSGLMNRASGVVVRRWRDLDTERREPYFRDPFEVLVGVRDIDGEPKPTMSELAAFARVVARVDLKRFALTQERTAVLMPSERFKPLPDLASLYGPRACLHSYISAKEAHLPVAVVHESEAFDPYSVIIVPSVFSLSDATWDRLRAWVQAGGSVVYSYGGGDAPDGVRELFGVEFLGDGGPREVLSCRIAQPDVLGPLSSFDARLAVSSFALLGHGGSTIVATDATGSPLLTLNPYGQGRAVLLAAPLERALAQDDPWAAPRAVKHFLRTVYAAAAGAAGCGAPVGCDVPDVEVALFAGEREDIVILLNHSGEDVTATLSFERQVATVGDVRGGTPAPVEARSLGVPMQGTGVSTLKVTYG